MFKLAVQTGGIDDRFGVDGAYRLIREAGFDAVDANVDHLFPTGDLRNKRPIPHFFRRDAGEQEIMEAFRPYREAAEKYGLENYQAHAPFPSVIQNGPADNEEYNEALLEMLRRTVIGAASIHCRNLVIHPFYYDYEHQCSLEEEWELNRKAYLRLAATAKEYGVTICLENMFRYYRGKRIAGVCNSPYEAAAYVDRLNEEAGTNVFGFCLDTGHALLVGTDIKNFITALGDRIACFHVHDNNGIEDQHLAPFMGVQDWDRFIEGLAAVRYDKTVSFETFNIWNRVDAELCPDLLKFIEKSGRMFDRKAEEIIRQTRS